MVTPEEYESLPPSIQKKYFSSVERLRIAQQSAVQKRKKQQPQPKDPWLSPRPSMDSIPSWNAPSSKYAAIPPPNKSASLRRMEADVDEQQALRFLSLPDKVRRSHFTPEELMLLTESSERALRWPSPRAEDVSPRTSIVDRMDSVCSSRYRSSISDELGDDIEKDWSESETGSINSAEHHGNDAAFVQASPRRQSSASSAFSAPPQALPRSGSETLGTRRKPSFAKRRAFSLAPIPLPPPTLRPAGSYAHSNVAPESLSQALPSAGTTPIENAPFTRYYKDSQARQKLREYLASPEKFDEALEFGFPTEAGAAKRAASHSPYPEDPPSADMDNVSLGDSRADEEDGSAVSPKTPSTNNETFAQGMTYHSSLDSGVAIPVNIGKRNTRSLSPDINGREMTLRMTLTRPDLRAPEQELYAHQRKEVSGVDVETSDPLALSTLSVCDDHTGAHGAFAIKTQPGSGGLRKAWKNIRGR
ncbi:Hypothetical predicted protein [Lecanosticta acicola]|uniref:Uncharacterized protein n=1 Tax=Lecanosticta acicola TaxID=111012 RepID=A0AAI9E7Z0_9PEZI|nr:Hypothetical predicted protein [Lecanosticta acicola]